MKILNRIMSSPREDVNEFASNEIEVTRVSKQFPNEEKDLYVQVLMKSY